ncbi:tetratricopeptide repeat protein [Actinomadura barringtoniae]|uniref:Tetratricopeptide repeat protein n=1 Tax=Actinomadura barringtoniae TaxID=1427535 RepID=A0A939P9Z3_9ACTN|nr:tetratricopeptide repeat protein [Actinomadura barringtoniae]MBO2448902.1 tetratricopeptide repeat protein [Actinomadura barringtoniae]
MTRVLRATADRRIRGPYTFGGALVATLLPGAPAELTAAYDIELRAMAPDLDVPERRSPLTARVDRSERILVPAPQHTLRLANGVAEFVRARLESDGVLTVHLTGIEQADQADRELLAVLERRVSALNVELDDDPGGGPLEDLTPEEHDARADALTAEGSTAVRLGAVPYHRARGTDRRKAAEDHLFAVYWCLDHGCHDAAAELGERGLAFADPGSRVWWELIHRAAMALGALEREQDAERLLHRARRGTTSAVWHSTICYSLAMLTTRHHDPAARDLDAAYGWINNAIALCGLLPDPAERAVKLGFDLNGKALVVSRLGDLDEALRLVQEAIDLADRDLSPGAQRVHRMVLLANRAQVYDRLGRTKEALLDWDDVITADPAYPDYYIDRGNLRHRLGMFDEAIADYEAAMSAGPPFSEPYFNRSQVRYDLGDTGGALADLDRALELDPGFTEAYPNRAGLLVALERHAEARADCEAGLRLTPDDPYLLCVLGQVEAAAGRHTQARDAFDRALERDPALAEAWASRGMLAFDTGDAAGAVADLTEAVVLSEDAPLLFNRAVVLRSLGRENEARDDLLRAQELAPDDEDIRKALS